MNNLEQSVKVTSKVIKILYLYNYENWAIHNVGKLWLNNQALIDVTYKKESALKIDDFRRYDFIWFGYLDLYVNYYLKRHLSSFEKNKCIVSIHDPLELFPEKKNWKSLGPPSFKLTNIDNWGKHTKLKLLSEVHNIVTASLEMQKTLSKYQLHTYVIPTTSLLNSRSKDQIKTTKCSLTSIYEIYPRKNISLMDEIKKYCFKNKIKFDTKVGKKILSDDDYAKLLDSHEIYICTSYQEGGPLPAMDAMKRGEVVITTPVGQLQEIIKDGENGYICNSGAEFDRRINELSNDLKLLNQLRIKSLESINSKRDINNIRKNVIAYLTNVTESPEQTHSKEPNPYKLDSCTTSTFQSHPYKIDDITKM